MSFGFTMWAKRLAKIFQWIWWISGSLVITIVLILAVILNVARAATPWVNQHPGQLQKKIESVFPCKLQFNTIHLSWSWLSPKIVLSDVNLKSSALDVNDADTLHIDEIGLSFNIMQTLLHAHLDLNKVSVTGAAVIVRQEVDGYRVNGFFIPRNNKEKSITMHSIVSMLSALKVSDIQLDNSQVTFDLMQHDQIQIQLQSVLLKQENSDYRLQGMMSVGPDHMEGLRFWIADNDAIGLGKVCLQITNLHIEHLKQWSFMLPFLNNLNDSWQSVFQLNTHVDATIWLELNQNQVTKIQSKIFLNQIEMDNQPSNQALSLMNSLSANIALVHSKLQWTLSADQIEGMKGNEVYPLGDFLLRYCDGDALNRVWTLYINHLNLAIFSQPVWIDFISGFPNGKEWADLNPHGFIDFMHLNLSNYKDNDLSGAHVQLQTFLNQVGWHAVGYLPSVSGVSGAIVGDDTAGIVRLNQSLGELNFIGLFKYPWMMNQTNIDGTWSYNAKDLSWKFNLNNLSLNDGHLNVVTQGALLGQGLHAPVADLHGDFSLNNVATVGHYLPITKTNPKLYDWLVMSLKEGVISNGHLILQGPLQFFPFKKNEGTFIASGDLQNTQLKFDPAWPALNDLNAHLIFQNNSMQLDQANAEMSLIQVSQIKAIIPSFINTDIDISSQLSGDLKDVNEFLLNTPLSVAKVFNDLKGEGAFSGALHLNLPIHHMSDQVKVNGSLTMQDATWQAPAWSMLMTHTHGILDFTESGVSTDDIEGVLFGSPTQIIIKPYLEEGSLKSATKVYLTGDYALPLLVKTYVPIFEPFVSGHASLVMDLMLHGFDSHQDDVLRLSSDLVGAEILQIPDGLSKKSDEKRDFHLMMQINNHKTLIHTVYDNTIDSKTVFDTQDNKKTLVSEHITMGGADIPSDENEGLAVSWKEQQSDLDTWFQLYNKYILKQAEPTKDPMMLNYLSAEIASGSLLNQDLKNIHCMVKKSDDEWDWRIASSRVNGNGHLPIHDESKPWDIDLKNANLRDIEIPKSLSFDKNNIAYSDFPSMHVSIGEFSYEKYNLHQLKFELSHPNQNQLFVDNIFVGNLILNLTADLHGVNLETTQPYWVFDGTLQGSDFGSGLTDLGLPVHLVSTSGQMKISSQINNAWPVGHWKEIVNKITATVDLSLENGSVIGLSPSVQSALGTLKLLNTLSIVSLPENLSGKGANGSLYFTKIVGSASLSHLQWQVPQITLSSSELSAVGSGYGQLDDQSVNFWVRLQPHLTGSVPVLAAFVAGPVVGAASWLVNKLFVSPMVSNAAAKSFHIMGKWPNLSVMPLNVNGS